MEPLRILPPDEGFAPRSMGLQLVATAAVLGACVAVLRSGVRRGIERASVVLTPLLFVGLVVLAVRAVTLPGAGEGSRREYRTLSSGPASRECQTTRIHQLLRHWPR